MHVTDDDKRERMKSEIISISLSKTLLETLDSIQDDRNFQSRSEVIRHCLQAYSKDLETVQEQDTTVGTYMIGISYYTAKTKPADLQDIIKDFSSDVIHTNRIMASSSVTMLLFILKTSINLARIFFEKLSSVRGLLDKKFFSLRTSI